MTDSAINLVLIFAAGCLYGFAACAALSRRKRRRRVW